MMASRASALRWSACFSLALFFHAAGAAALLARWNDNADSVVNAPVITIELGPVTAAPAVVPNDSPQGPPQMQAEPEPQPEKPVDKVAVPVAPHAELELSPPPKTIEKPKDKKPKQKHATLASAPRPEENRAEHATASTSGASSRNLDALHNWQTQLAAQIERHKRYPEAANGDHGEARVAFSVDRGGRAHSARIVASSGSSVLDRDALAWLERSQPLPPPPPEVVGAMIPVTVPLRYSYR
jgi:protein TonB